MAKMQYDYFNFARQDFYRSIGEWCKRETQRSYVSLSRNTAQIFFFIKECTIYTSKKKVVYTKPSSHVLRCNELLSFIRIKIIWKIYFLPKYKDMRAMLLKLALILLLMYWLRIRVYYVRVTCAWSCITLSLSVR